MLIVKVFHNEEQSRPNKLKLDIHKQVPVLTTTVVSDTETCLHVMFLHFWTPLLLIDNTYFENSIPKYM